MKLFIASAMLLMGLPAMATELYHCAVNDVTDGYFNESDLVVDGSKISGSTTFQGIQKSLGDMVFGNSYTDGGKDYIELIYQDGREGTESLSFSLPDVTGKLGPAVRTSTREGFDSIDKPVEMLCEMATPI